MQISWHSLIDLRLLSRLKLGNARPQFLKLALQHGDRENLFAENGLDSLFRTHYPSPMLGIMIFILIAAVSFMTGVIVAAFIDRWRDMKRRV